MNIFASAASPTVSLDALWVDLGNSSGIRAA